jgi:cation diffusion facilitator family transporter
MPVDIQQNGKFAAYKRVQRVLWIVLVANLAVTVVKLTIGFLTGALAIVADGFHSLVDSSTNLIGLASIRLARRPADEEHPYGYRRYETIGALAIGGMLLVSAYEISEAIITRLIDGSRLTLSPLLLGFVFITFPINLVVFVLEHRAGKRLGSEILLADAEHTRTDLFISLSVILGMAGVWLGLYWLDLVLAGVIVLLILRAAFGILRDSASWLTDRIMADPERVERIAGQVAGVLFVTNVRSRGAPGFAFVDLHVKVHPGMSTEQAHAIASEVERRLKAEMEGVVDALVHIEPAREPVRMIEQISYELRQLADGMGLGIHDIHVRAREPEGYAVELHLELKGEISLVEAHALADEFERRAGGIVYEPLQIVTHLEPIPDQVLKPGGEIARGKRQKYLEAITGITDRGHIQELDTYQLGGRVGVAVTIRADPLASLNEAHLLAENIERALMASFPEIHRVTVHMEPEAGGQDAKAS